MADEFSGKLEPQANQQRRIVMPKKFKHNNIPLVKRQAQIARYSLKEYSELSTPKSNEMLDYWVQCFGYSNWQYFIRQINGHSSDKTDAAILSKDNFLSTSISLHKFIPDYDLEHIKWGLTSSLQTNHCINSNMIKKLLVRSVPTPLSPQLNELLRNGFIEVDTRRSTNSNEDLIVGYIPTELGKYAAAQQHENNSGQPLSRIDLVKFGLSDNLCKLKRIHSATSIN